MGWAFMTSGQFGVSNNNIYTRTVNNNSHRKTFRSFLPGLHFLFPGLLEWLNRRLDKPQDRWRHLMEIPSLEALVGRWREKRPKPQMGLVHLPPRQEQQDHSKLNRRWTGCWLSHRRSSSVKVQSFLPNSHFTINLNRRNYKTHSHRHRSVRSVQIGRPNRSAWFGRISSSLDWDVWSHRKRGPLNWVQD